MTIAADPYVDGLLFQVNAPDQPGGGDAPSPGSPTRATTYVDEVAQGLGIRLATAFSVKPIRLVVSLRFLLRPPAGEGSPWT